MAKTPPDLQYSESHEWVRLEGDTATLGITDFAQDQLTDVVYVELPKKGARVDAKKAFGVVESVKSVSELYSPVTGEVIDVNETLEKRPEQINDDPYGAGWLIRVRLRDATRPEGLLDAAAYQRITGA